MRRRTWLAILLIAGSTCTWAPPAAGEEERNSDKSPGGRSTQGSGGKHGSVGATPSSTSRASGAFRVSDDRGGSSQDHSAPSYGAAPTGRLFGSQSTDPSSDSAGFSGLDAALADPGYAAYLGLGAGKGAAYFNSSSFSKFAWQLFLGARMRYFGTEIGYTHLSTVPATINSQQVDLSTETLSLSLLGYLPLTPDSDLFLRYGGLNWSVNANSSTVGYTPVTNGINRMWGAGVEFRSGRLFLGVERDIFRHVYQSNYYSFVGIRLGAYLD